MKIGNRWSDPRWLVFGKWLAEKQDDIKPRPSDRQLAKIIGISSTHLSDIKRGLTGVKESTLAKIADGLHVDINEVRDKYGLQSLTPAPREILLAKRLLNIMGDLPTSQWHKVEEQLEKDAAQYVSLLTA